MEIPTASTLSKFIKRTDIIEGIKQKCKKQIDDNSALNKIVNNQKQIKALAFSQGLEQYKSKEEMLYLKLKTLNSRIRMQNSQILDQQSYTQTLTERKTHSMTKQLIHGEGASGVFPQTNATRGITGSTSTDIFITENFNHTMKGPFLNGQQIQNHLSQKQLKSNPRKKKSSIKIKDVRIPTLEKTGSTMTHNFNQTLKNDNSFGNINRGVIGLTQNNSGLNQISSALINPNALTDYQNCSLKELNNPITAYGDQQIDMKNQTTTIPNQAKRFAVRSNPLEFIYPNSKSTGRRSKGMAIVAAVAAGMNGHDTRNYTHIGSSGFSHNNSMSAIRNILNKTGDCKQHRTNGLQYNNDYDPQNKVFINLKSAQRDYKNKTTYLGNKETQATQISSTLLDSSLPGINQRYSGRNSAYESLDKNTSQVKFKTSQKHSPAINIVGITQHSSDDYKKRIRQNLKESYTNRKPIFYKKRDLSQNNYNNSNTSNENLQQQSQQVRVVSRCTTNGVTEEEEIE